MRGGALQTFPDLTFYDVIYCINSSRNALKLCKLDHTAHCVIKDSVNKIITPSLKHCYVVLISGNSWKAMKNKGHSRHKWGEGGVCMRSGKFQTFYSFNYFHPSLSSEVFHINCSNSCLFNTTVTIITPIKNKLKGCNNNLID